MWHNAKNHIFFDWLFNLLWILEDEKKNKKMMKQAYEHMEKINEACGQWWSQGSNQGRIQMSSTPGSETLRFT